MSQPKASLCPPKCKIAMQATETPVRDTRLDPVFEVLATVLGRIERDDPALFAKLQAYKKEERDAGNA